MRFLKVFLLLSGVLVPWTSRAQGFFEYPPPSPFNGRVLNLPDSAWGYTFYVGGHLYGAHGNAASIYPAASFLANIERLNANPGELLVCTGDLVRDGAQPAQWTALRHSLAGLRMPVFNAPGNHDLKDRAAYAKAFGDGNDCFFVRDDCFLILDTELIIEGKTDALLDFLKQQQNLLRLRPQGVRNLFVFSHRLLWSICEKGLDEADALSNQPAAGMMDGNSPCEVFDKVVALAGKAPIYWFSGDVGTPWSVPLLYMEGKGRYIASGIGDTDHDALVKTQVDAQGKVALTVFPLSDAKWAALEAHTPAYVREHFAVEQEGFGDQVKAMLRGRALWVGVVLGASLALLICWLLRKRRKQVS